ncbi:hypothetical protein HAX54_037141, partial [Datura stramonium]|nr:hypothetical protein [Datura stramonium]
TLGAIIDVRVGKLRMRVHDEKAIFIMYKTISTPSHYKDLCIITELVKRKCRVKEKEYERPIVSMVTKSKKHTLKFGEWSEHELNGGEVERKHIGTESDEPLHRRTKRMKEP